MKVDLPIENFKYCVKSLSLLNDYSSETSEYDELTKIII